MLTQQVCEQARISRDPRFDGLFFVLVKTTKIFCRNTCKVRMPLEKNVEYSDSAQQALNQGYRPCLRCRPDSAPHSCAWEGVNTTVVRAVKLLTEKLDLSIESVASNLGITTRYLNKLFQDHMQMSAKRYRIYQQVLMAKQLLQQTRLPIENVAESVGFPSARQLQQHVKTYLRLTPSQLRKSNDSNKAILPKDALSETMHLLLAYRPPYNWPQVRDFFAKRQIHGNELITKNGLQKTLRIVTEKVSTNKQQANINIKIDVEYLANKNAFCLSFNAAYSRHTLAIIATVRRMLDLDADPQCIERALKSAGLGDEQIVPGLRIPGVASEFEAGCRAILGQQVSVAAAVNKVNQLHAHFAKAQGHENLEYGFACPSEVANSDLLFLKMPAARRQTLIELAKYYERKSTQPSTTSAANTDENHNSLIAIKGIGPWTVNYIGLRALAETDIWLDSDLVIKQQVTKLDQLTGPLKPELAAPWRSYLTLNLWSLAK